MFHVFELAYKLSDENSSKQKPFYKDFYNYVYVLRELSQYPEIQWLNPYVHLFNLIFLSVKTILGPDGPNTVKQFSELNN